MKTFKIMSIIGIVFAALCFLCVIGFNNPVDYEASVGYGIYASLYLLAFSIVVLVMNKKQ